MLSTEHLPAGTPSARSLRSRHSSRQRSGAGDPDEGNEPPHIHVRTPDGDCKFWLEPSIMLASNRGVRPYDLRKIEGLIFDNEQILKKAYDDRHSR